MLYRNTKTGYEFFSKSVVHADGVVLIDPIATTEQPEVEPVKEEPKKKKRIKKG